MRRLESLASQNMGLGTFEKFVDISYGHQAVKLETWLRNNLERVTLVNMRRQNKMCEVCEVLRYCDESDTREIRSVHVKARRVYFPVTRKLAWFPMYLER